MKKVFTTFKQTVLSFHFSILCCAFVLATAWNQGLAQSTTVFLEPSQDNSLYEDANGTLSNALGIGLYAGVTNNGDLRRGLIQFDFSEIPAGATIESASITLNKNKVRSGSGDQAVSLHKMLASWGEATSEASGQGGGGTTSSNGDATWIHRFFPDSSWATAGGDFEAIASVEGTTNGSNIEVVVLSSDGMVADVQNWVNDPTTNFGWLIAGNENATGSARRYQSREAENPPVLEITFTAPEEVATASLQIIHNSPDPAADIVDIYVNDSLTVDNLAFRGATSFVDVPADVALDIAVAPAASTSSADAVATFSGVTFAPDVNFVAMAAGLIDTTLIVDGPNTGIGFTLIVFDSVLTAGTSDSVFNFFTFHGSPDAPAIDVLANGGALISNLSYPNATEYFEITDVNTPLELAITPAGDSSTVVASFLADFSTLAGQAGVLFAAGFLAPGEIEGAPPFGLSLALPNGDVIDLSTVTSIADRFEEIPGLSLFPNPAQGAFTIQADALESAPVALKVFDLQGKTVLVREANPINGSLDMTINTNELTPAIYTVFVQQNDKVSVRLISIQ